MKTFKVDVSYMGFGPDETPERSGETHIVEAADEFEAENKAIALCTHQGMCEDAEAIAIPLCRKCGDEIPKGDSDLCGLCVQNIAA